MSCGYGFAVWSLRLPLLALYRWPGLKDKSVSKYKESFLILIFLGYHGFHPFHRCRIMTVFDTTIVLGLYELHPGLSSIFSCWAGPGVPKRGTRKVMPMSVAPQVLGGVEDSGKDLKSSYMSHLPVICQKTCNIIMSFKDLHVNRRDNRSMSLVHLTDRDLLTPLGQNNIDLHQIRVPRFEFGTGLHYSTQAAEVLLN